MEPFCCWPGTSSISNWATAQIKLGYQGWKQAGARTRNRPIRVAYLRHDRFRPMDRNLEVP
jgi:hypothetical protein